MMFDLTSLSRTEVTCSDWLQNNLSVGPGTILENTFWFWSASQLCGHAGSKRDPLVQSGPDCMFVSQPNSAFCPQQDTRGHFTSLLCCVGGTRRDKSNRKHCHVDLRVREVDEVWTHAVSQLHYQKFISLVEKYYTCRRIENFKTSGLWFSPSGEPINYFLRIC